MTPYEKLKALLAEGKIYIPKPTWPSPELKSDFALALAYRFQKKRHDDIFN